MYPALCIPGAEDAIEKYESNADFILGDKYEIRFVLIEWFADLKRLLKKQCIFYKPLMKNFVFY